MSNGYPNFPREGQYVKFNTPYYLVEGQEINAGDIAQVVKVELNKVNYEISRYIIYLGLNDGRVFCLDYTSRHSMLEIVPNTLAGRVLYGSV